MSKTEEYCKNCKYYCTLNKWDYSKFKSGEWKEVLPGFICNAFWDEHEAIWMVNKDNYSGYCEMFSLRDEVVNG